MGKYLNKSAQQSLMVPIIVATVLFMEFMDITIINTAIPSIAKDFVINPILLKFSVASYYLSLAIFIPVSGWCIDKFGTKKIFIISIVIFIFSSFLCGLSHNVLQLSIFRFTQGVGGAFMVPVARVVLLKSFPSEQLVKVQSIAYTPALAGNAAGPFIGGIITDYYGWNWIFFINIPIGLALIFFCTRFILQYKSDYVKPFDFKGFIIAGLSLCSITFFVEMLNHYDIFKKGLVYFSGFIGIILFCILILYCLKNKNAIFDVSLFKIQSLRVGFSIYFSTSAINASVGFLLPLMFQECFKMNPTQSGFIILPIAFGMVFARGAAGKVIGKIGFKLCIILNLLIFMLALILLAQITKSTPLMYILASEFIFGTSMIMVNSCVGALNYIELPKDKISVATSMDITARQFSSSLGIGICALIITLFIQYLNLNLYNSNAQIFHYTFYVMIVFVVLALFTALKLKRTGKIT